MQSAFPNIQNNWHARAQSQITLSIWSTNAAGSFSLSCWSHLAGSSCARSLRTGAPQKSDPAGPFPGSHSGPTAGARLQAPTPKAHGKQSTSIRSWRAMAKMPPMQLLLLHSVLMSQLCMLPIVNALDALLPVVHWSRCKRKRRSHMGLLCVLPTCCHPQL